MSDGPPLASPGPLAPLAAPLPLGAFVIRAPLGQGGMGEVWRGVHRVSRLPVAIKVLNGSLAGQPRVRASFYNEVRAVAALDHPGIITVLDYGEVTAEAERISQGRVRAGSPYLVMELATRGSLLQLPTPIPWPRLQGMLLELLDALAHAHARGVVHRDLKPGNVLLDEPRSGRRGARPGIKLADFGVAQAAWQRARTGNTDERVMGSPPFMAPEQFFGRWRDYGPWTDLYALGCMAWWLTSGRLPYFGENHSDFAQAHIHQPLPRLEPRMEVPAGFEAWLQHLLAKRFQERFQRAADAAWELQQLELPQVSRRSPSGLSTADCALLTLPGPDAPRDTTAAGRLVAGATAPGEVIAGGGTAPDLDPLPAPEAAGEQADTTTRQLGTQRPPARPEQPLASLLWQLEELAGAPDDGGHPVPPQTLDWRGPRRPRRSAELVGAGLGLFGVRAIPLVGREQERDRLWSKLAEVRAHRAARLVCLSGAPGSGKSRLARWLSERGHETGAATPLLAQHDPLEGPASGVGRMIGRQLNCVALDAPRVAERIRRALAWYGVTDPYEWKGLSAIVAPGGDPDAPPLTDTGSRHALIRRQIERLARRRPVILWLDDVHHSSDTLVFVRNLLRSREGARTPILVVLTVNHTALAERPIEADLLAELLTLEQCDELAIPPLSHAASRQLVDEMLGLDAELTTQVVRRAAGNPQFAVQLVSDWVQRGLLELRRRGFGLAGGARGEVPDTVHQLWDRRLTRLLREFGEDRGGPIGVALELAAVLGQRVDEAEWHALCQLSGVEVPLDLLELLLARGLAERDEEGWRFLHSGLRESLERSARESGCWAEYHRSCARMLGQRRDALDAAAERLGRHLLEAGAAAQALPALTRAALQREERGDYHVALGLLARREQALRQLAVPEAEPRWGEGWMMRSWNLFQLSRLDEALEVSLKARGAALEHGWQRVLAESLHLAGRVTQLRGDGPSAERLLNRAVALFEQLGERKSQGRCLVALAQLAQQGGRLEHARSLLEQAEAQQRRGDPKGLANALRMRGYIHVRRHEYEAAEALFQRSRTWFRKLHHQHGLAATASDLATLARARGAAGRAEQLYREAWAHYRNLGSLECLAQLGLGLALLEQDRFGEAGELLADAGSALRRIAQPALLMQLASAEALVRAARGDWQGVRRRLKTAEAAFRGRADPDAANPIERVGDRAAAAGEQELAQRAWSFAARQWMELDEQRRVAQVERKLRGG